MIRGLLLIVGLAAAGWFGWSLFQGLTDPPRVGTAVTETPAPPEPAPVEPPLVPLAPETEPPLPPPEVKMASALVAARDISVQTPLKPGDLAWSEVKESELPVGAVREAVQPEVLEAATGLVSVVPMTAGQLVIWSMLQQPAQETDLSGMLSDGKSAMAISVTAQTAAGGFIRPGDRVDVISLPAKGSAEVNKSTASLVTSGVRVLAVDQNTSQSLSENPSDISSLILELSPSEVIAVSQAIITGSVSVSLRRRNDVRPSIVPEAPRSKSVRIIRQSGIEFVELMK